MVALTQEEQQLVRLFRNLPEERRRHVMLAMADADRDAWKRYHEQGEQKLRAIAHGRGLAWDTMTEAERLAFVEDVLAEDGR